MPRFLRFLSTLALGGIVTTLGATSPAGASSRVPGVTISGVPALRAAALSPVTVAAPSNVISVEGEFVSITATAIAADPQAVVTITATGMPPGPAFSSNTPTNIQPSATISGTLGPGSAGIWTIRWEATTSFGESSVDSTVLFVRVANAAPVLTPPTSMTLDEGTLATQALSANDPDGDRLFFTKTLGPSFMMVGTTGPSTGEIDLAPNTLEAGTYPARVITSDGSLSAQSDTFFITVNDVPHAPVADPGGPYFGRFGIPVLIDGTGSYDPDGDPLRYLWRFIPSYPYSSPYGAEGPTLSLEFPPGATTVQLVVLDNGSPPLSSGPAYTTVTIPPLYRVSAFASPQNQTLRLDSSRPVWCLQIQFPPDVQVQTVVPESTVLAYGGRWIHAIGQKTTMLGDANHDGIPDLSQCFSKADLRWLFATLPPGHSVVDLQVTGDFSLGTFQGGLRIEVVKSGGGSGVIVSPNPLNPGGTVAFTTARTGPVTLRIYDLQGRLMHTVLHDPSLPAGRHVLRLDGRRDDGTPFASGIYFFRFEGPGQRATGRFCVLK